MSYSWGGLALGNPDRKALERGGPTAGLNPESR